VGSGDLRPYPVALPPTDGEVVSDIGDYDPSSTPTLEVLVYCGDELLAAEPCDSEDEAAETMAGWNEHDGVRCVVRDISARATDRTGEPDADDEVLLDRPDDYVSDLG
jgi:hypothetical protein